MAYSTKGNDRYTIHNGGCLEVLPSIADGSVDMVMVDLPYGTTERAWDVIIPFDQLWAQYNRVCKENAAFVFTAQQPFTTAVVMSNIENFRYQYAWIKNQATGFMNANKMPLKNIEDVLVFYRKLPTYNPQMRAGRPYHMVHKDPHKWDDTSVYGRTGLKAEPTVHHNEGTRHPAQDLNFDVEVGFHPTQKPVALMEWLIKTYTNPGELVLDNTMGSGTTGVAAMRAGRRFIGMEADAVHFATAQMRIDRESNQERMF
jgi:site-specific DNA-methyltransferase (adenine-specific)